MLEFCSVPKKLFGPSGRIFGYLKLFVKDTGPPLWYAIFSLKFFLHLLCILLVPLIFPYSAQILLENALLCRQNARLKNRLLCSKLCRQNLSKPTPWRKLLPADVS